MGRCFGKSLLSRRRIEEKLATRAAILERHTAREVSSQQATFAESESQAAVVWTVGKTLHS